VAAGKLDVEHLALPDAGDAIDAERLQRALDGLALRIEDAGFQRDGDARFHRRSALHQHRAGPGRALVLAHDAEPLGDLGVSLDEAAEIAAEAVLVELLVRLDVPQPARIR